MADSNKIIHEYLVEIQKILQSGDAREHAYRPAFQRLIQGLKPEIQVINEPAYTGGNAPDFLFKSGATPVAYAECKDVTVDITNSEVQKQANRYVEAFGRILLTNYFNFQILSEEGEVVAISIADKSGDQIIARQSEFERFANIIQDYITPFHRTIRSARKLAEIMASKARILRDNALASLTENPDSDIYAQYKTFKEVLIRELSEQEFADMYAQTLVYGLFVARYYDSTIKTFSRHEAQDLLPASNPLLKKFFGHVAGTDYDPKIAWLVDSLVEAYLSTNVYELMHKEFATKQKDPVLHFYETFLAEYDKGLRKNRGVYYTPEPVVSFIVRSVDEILKTKFNLPKGLADTSTIDHQEKIQAEDARRKDGIKRKKNQIHRVQVLDPAVGTGTFLNEVINVIFKSFKGQEGLWSSYVRDHLLPRIHGFELMMASYTMAHLKLGVTLKELGYSGDERLSVWLTNSLEESVHEVPNLFMSQWLTEESHEASRIKSELPIMVVLGNPPYSVSSANKGVSIMDLISVYKENLNERNIQSLSDDYIKFIRFAEHQIEKSGCGVVAMITNNSFIDGVTHRQMRKHLMETFDEIYILDLHGNAKKKEVAPDGGKDENVFNIMQGVSINLFIKNGDCKGMANVYHSELFGKQKEKYEKLDQFDFETIKWEKLKTVEPYYFFVPKDFSSELLYNRGFKIDELFVMSSMGIATARDSQLIWLNRKSAENLLADLNELDKDDFLIKYNFPGETEDWRYCNAKSDIADSKITKIAYRPFDERWTIYSGNSKGVMARPRGEIMSNLLQGNIALNLCKHIRKQYEPVFVSRYVTDKSLLSSLDNSYAFPLYLQPDSGDRIPNLDQTIWDKINETVDITQPEDILDYIYAVLHSQDYREKYKEFLKIDFPRIPYPKDKKIFKKLMELGRKLRGLHLLEDSSVNEFMTTFPIGGSNIVEKKYPKYDDGKVYINGTQYFGSVPKVMWDFYIGGYQPAQKWLKDRQERTLSSEDIEHYQKMIVALKETVELMENIDKVVTF
ncbi:DNA methyltransferase [Candidatus Peregrinibacteria bacterium]|nr:MAG: DNA methyltransferase [Candidatus Peregrinibacteria bacterium]